MPWDRADRCERSDSRRCEPAPDGAATGSGNDYAEEKEYDKQVVWNVLRAEFIVQRQHDTAFTRWISDARLDDLAAAATHFP